MWGLTNSIQPNTVAGKEYMPANGKTNQTARDIVKFKSEQHKRRAELGFIDEPVSVVLYYSHKMRKSMPKKVLWNNTIYDIESVGLHHKIKSGEILYHVFSITTGTVFMELKFNTSNLQWKLSNIKDEHSSYS